MSATNLTNSASEIPFQNLVLITLGFIVLAIINNSSKLVGAFIKLRKEYSKKAGEANEVQEEIPSRAPLPVNIALCIGLFVMCVYTLFVTVPWRPNPQSLSDLLLFRAFAISLSTSTIAVMVAWFMNRK